MHGCDRREHRRGRAHRREGCARLSESTLASESSRSVRIADDELSILQRNIVLSHAAGTGGAVARPDRAVDDGIEASQASAWARRA